jgi:cation diffusion facilitator CzcD-associated flavoprotein CzcO
MSLQAATAVERVDVVIVGAGISGIGAAYHLHQNHPGKSYAILEARAATGGTWDLFRYPGIRSDSDLHTFGYAFKPWDGERAIAPGAEILAYLRETASENGIDDKIRVNHKVLSASWETSAARWTVEIERTDTGALTELSCGWLFCASGYYNYEQGFTPDFAGTGEFDGQIVHPQQWPEDLDYAGKRVVVIGSGATAVTLIPAMAETAEHVTMLQRSPSYIIPVPSQDAIANTLRKVVGKHRAHAITRRKNILGQRLTYKASRRFPRAMRRLIRRANAKALPADFPVDTHFQPRYDPWDQRLCAVPDGDLFKALSDGSASIVTDRIDTFTRRGLLLESGRELEADIVVTATGLNVLAFGGITFTVDGVEIELPKTTAFRSMMLSDVPNFAFSVGYTNSSWTLKVDLVCEHLCRLLAHMDAHGHDVCRVEVTDPAMETRALLDFSAGYVQRAVDSLPRAGFNGPWQVVMDYATDVKVLREGPITDPAVRFSPVVRELAVLATPELVAAWPAQTQIGQWALTDSPQALGPERKRGRANSPLLQGNDLIDATGARAE